MTPINIFDKNIELNFKKGTYNINLIGGWGVKLNEFKLKLISSDKKEIVATKTKFPVQNLTDKKTKRILTVNIQKEGKYEVIISNPNSLVVYSSNLFILNLISKPIDNKSIQIVFDYKILTLP